ncbi:sulfate ABC transporter permease subunit CysT [Luteibacter aegosomaticola]|uniref:sulfate ABC transporter permease subunit CysT n=1 Tax=Luteibacter aegosomaticola TaxID=2911538 RepID=UPI001FFABC6C|nr:sulfate ABC transporter permease subunit CysT [Luteibacter aegosomaticola]UPG88134.1 sulfate ABC transporter permease subunit CysT [Luteibacter aegosomaticola]
MRRRVLPGFGLSLGYTVTWLGLVVLLPLAALAWKASDIGTAGVLKLFTSPRTLAALKLSFGGAFLAALANVFMGLIVTWALVRCRFPGRRILDALIDLPFALPTAVAGIALTAIYAPNGWIGQWLAPLGIKVAYTPLGVLLAMVFVGFPFVVRTLQPVLQSLERDVEDAAESLGATPGQTFLRVILPPLLPTLLTGFALALARAVGEYGSVIFIAGNIPLRSEIAPLLIVQRLEEFDYATAAALGVVMLAFSLTLLVALSAWQRWTRRWAEVPA